PRDARGGQDQALGQVDSAEALFGRAGEVEHHLVVVDRQAVAGDEVGVQGTGQGRVGSEQTHPGVHARTLLEYLRSQYLTAQRLSAILVDNSSIPCWEEIHKR